MIAHLADGSLCLCPPLSLLKGVLARWNPCLDDHDHDIFTQTCTCMEVLCFLRMSECCLPACVPLDLGGDCPWSVNHSHNVPLSCTQTRLTVDCECILSLMSEEWFISHTHKRAVMKEVSSVLQSTKEGTYTHTHNRHGSKQRSHRPSHVLND